MTWSRFDDAAPKHPKAKVAGNEAWSLWSAAVMYCNRYNTDGFVPLAALATECLPEPMTLAKAKKLAERLVAAKVRPDGIGLLVQVEGGYMVHDFLDFNPSKGEVEQKRKVDRDRKRGAASRSGTPPDSHADSERNPNGTNSGIRVDSEPPAPAGARAPVRPVPPAHTQPVDVRPEAPPPVVSYSDWDSPELTECPGDLYERARASGALQLLSDELGANLWDVEWEARDFVHYWRLGKGMRGLKAHWLAELRQRIVRRHHDGKLAGCGDPRGAEEHRERTSRSRREAELPGAQRERATVVRLGKPAPITAGELDEILKARESVLDEPRAAGVTT